MPQELINFLQAAQALIKAPWFFWVPLALAGVLLLAPRRAVFLARVRRVGGYLREKWANRPRVGKLAVSPAVYLLLGLAAVNLVSNRGCSLPDFPSIVVTDGPRHVVIIRESSTRTVAQKTLEIDLRDGEHATYLKSKQHKLDILEPDAVGQDGNPVPLVETLKAQQAPPALFVLDGQKVLSKQPLPATAEAVIAAVKGAGG